MASGTLEQGSMVLQSDLSATEKVCCKILGILKKRNYDQDVIFAVHLSLEEAVINAVKHGNKLDPKKIVTVEYSIDNNKVEIDISDQGNGFNPSAVPDPRLGDNLYKTEGRGLLLIRSYMDVVNYNRKGTRLHMMKYCQPEVVDRTKNNK